MGTGFFMRAKVIWAALAVLCITVPASAQECNKSLRLIATLPMAQWRNSNLVTIPVSINGVEKQFLLDTGGYFTQISPAMADELKIPQHQGNAQMYAADGSVSRTEVAIHNFAIGPLHAEEYEMPVSPNAGFEGIFSPLGYKTVDFDLDFSAAKVNLLLSDHCEGKVFYWPHQASAVVPYTHRENKFIVPVTLDGKEWNAIIDTGASTSTLRLDDAEFVYGLSPDSPNMSVVGHVGNDERAPIFNYPFKTLTFGDITVTNPHIRIYTDIMGKKVDYGGNKGLAERAYHDITLPDVIIGMDVLRKLHLYLAQNENRLYITEASTPATASPTAQPASANQPK
jgi:predicted aspartyl protease